MTKIIITLYKWKSFDNDTKNIANFAKKYKFKNIYGIPRGGIIVAVKLSHLLNIPIILDYRNITNKTLVVDDILDTGKTLSNLFSIIKFKPKVATLFWYNKSKKPDFWCREKLTWVVFPWETNITSKYDDTLI